MLSQAFGQGDIKEIRGALVRTINCFADLAIAGDRERLTALWKDIAQIHYELPEDLTAEIREQKGYLEALVHSTKAIRDQCENPEVMNKVRVCEYGSRILNIISQEGSVSHEELTKILEINSDLLTEELRMLSNSNTVSGTLHGKVKHYSLTQDGAVAIRYL